MKTIILEKIRATEKIIKQIEIDNTLVFQVDRSITKNQIKQEVEKVFNVKVDCVRTYTHKNKKHAYVKLKKEYLAIDIATKMGVV